MKLNINTNYWNDSFQTYQKRTDYKKIVLDFLGNTKNANILTSISAIGGLLLLIIL